MPPHITAIVYGAIFDAAGRSSSDAIAIKSEFITRTRTVMRLETRTGARPTVRYFPLWSLSSWEVVISRVAENTANPASAPASGIPRAPIEIATLGASIETLGLWKAIWPMEPPAVGVAAIPATEVRSGNSSSFLAQNSVCPQNSWRMTRTNDEATWHFTQCLFAICGWDRRLAGGVREETSP